MNNNIKVTLSLYATLALITACSSNISVNNTFYNGSFVSSEITSRYAVRGKAEFPSSLSPSAGTVTTVPYKPSFPVTHHSSPFILQATLGEVGDRATISLIYPPDAGGGNANVTIATGLTDASGVFSINPTVSFTPATNDIFVLEAAKRIGSAGYDVITVRTYIKRNGASWDTITTPDLFINSKTTALTIIDSYDNSINSNDTIGTIVSGTPGDVGSVTSATINKVTDFVDNLLIQNVDPVRNISYANSKYYVNREINHAKVALNTGLNCPNCNLKNEDLSIQDYTGKDLSNAIFTGANLSNSNFTNANLTGATTITSATLTGADFSGATWHNGAICNSGSIGTCTFPIGDFKVNTYTTSNQKNPEVAMDGDGDFVIVWQSGSFASTNQDGHGYGIYAQRYDSSGSALGTEFRVNIYTTYGQKNPAIAMDSTGNFIIAWESNSQEGVFSSYGIYAQRYASTGSAIGSEFQVNTYTSNQQVKPSVAMDNSGNFIISWHSSQGGSGGYGVYAQRYNSDGTTNGSEFRVNTYTTSNNANPSVVMDNSGNFIISWQSYQDGGSGTYGPCGIYAQRYNSDGSTNGSEFQVNTYTTGRQDVPSVAMDNNGNFVITWQSNQGGGAGTFRGYGIYAQRYNSNGTPNDSEFNVNTHTTNRKETPSVAMDNDGNFVVTWHGNGTDDTYGIFAKRYNSYGVGQ